jgi:hypothetical protein
MYNDVKKIKCTLMKCHTNDSTSSTQLPHKFSYIVAILGHNHFESPNIGIFIFDGGNKRLRNVTKLYCQCQISHKRRKKECLGKFKFSLNRLKK